MSPQTDRVELAQSVLEGVAFSFADAKECLVNAGTSLGAAGVIGGGARSQFWTRILASVLDMPLTRYVGADKGPAFGAARLARLAARGEPVQDVCTKPRIHDVIEPEPRLVAAYAPRVEAYRRLYRALKAEFLYAPNGLD
jgi:xylulokinase